MAFHESTQHSFWLFSSQDDLARLRSSINQEAVDRLTRIHATHGTNDDGKYLTSEDEQLYLAFYLQQLAEAVVPAFPFPLAVKRFYLTTSVMDYHPKHIILTCFYMACKTEEINIDLSAFVTNLELSESDSALILQLEIILVQRLHFHLVVFHPMRSLRGFFYDVRARGAVSQTAELEAAYRDAKALIDQSFMTDACFLAPPSQLALAALCIACANHGIDLTSYISANLQAADKPEQTTQLTESLERAKTLIQMKATEIDSSKLKRVDKKLKKCRNPELDPDSPVYAKV
ncbi:hypothetical protein CAOG_04347 [Capsaspora owczarzaki ATCC 30864]|uniref:hypothetical protein n=1 Tax=Capsaspora owczarzaki (strain ATCC 30864) TaxID=595528 RepID=UPI000352639D|nr:hypothetical protein CAOG_04347 [Capsaspora owczarzaki ATCC 30864]|eukprot:XP_004348175.2 hypothetical protein CAOG_04347 [Capsaspora owczarzaki ATCC 30864]